MKTPLRLTSGFLASLLALTASAQTSSYWDPDNSGGLGSGGTGNWNLTDPNWSNGTSGLQLWNNGDLAVFGGISGTVTVNQTLSAAAANFLNNYTLNIATGNTLAVSGAVDFGSSTLSLGGAGTLQVGGTNGIAGNGTLAFNGGNVQVIGSGLTTSVNATLANSPTAGPTAIYTNFNTNGFASSWSGNIVGATGGFIKSGAGDLTLSGAGNNIGSFKVVGGSVTQSTGSISSSEISVGTDGGSGTYNMNGGTMTLVTGTPPIIVGGSASSLRIGDFGGTGVFNQTNGTVNVSGSMNVGNQGGNGTLNLSGGAMNLADGLYNIGRTAGGSAPASTGLINLSGSGLLNVTSGSFIIGSRDNGANSAASSGTLTQTGGIFRIDNSAALFLGGFGTSTYNLNGGTLEVGGTSLRGNFGASTTYNFNLGGGTIQVAGSNLVTSVNANLANSTTSFFNTAGFDASFSGNIAGLRNTATGGSLTKVGAGTLTFDGAGTRYGNNLKVGNVGLVGGVGGSITQTAGTTDFQYVAVGADAGSGTYHMNGGTLGGSSSDMTLHVGDFGGTGTFNQTTGLVQPGSTRSLNIGNRGGSGTYNISGGQLILSATSNLGRNAPADTGASSSGTLNISGTAQVMLQGSAELVLSSRQETTLASVGDGSQGTVVQSGGTLRVQDNAVLFLGGAGTGTYNLNGGVLEVGGNGLRGNYFGTAGAYSFNLGGGTIRVIGSALNTSVNANLNAGVYSTLDTNGLGATWSGNVTGTTGGLVKTGAGTVILSGANNIGSFKVTGGAVTQSGGSLSSSEISVGTDGGNGTYNMNGGTMTLVTGTPPPIVGGSASSLRVGDFGGTGVFNQTNGTVNVSGSLNVGNQGGNGTYNLSGGTTNLADGLYNIGRTAGGSAPASTGQVNLSGTGTLNVTNGNFIIGSRDNGVNVAGSSGTLTQTGGTFRVNGTGGANNLFLGGFGSGTYNLNGGALEIGGNALQGNYLSSTTPYAFNLGGGTVRVINTALTTSVTSTLMSATTTTIDTNGLGATWSGRIAGSGSLTKAGAGTLTLNAPTGNTYSGTTTVSGGVLRAAGTAANPALGGTSAVVVNNGAALVQAAASQINAAANMTLGGGTFDTGGFNTTLGTLTVNDFGSVIDMATGGPNTLAFADSSAQTWSGTLSIYNWTGQVVNHTMGGDVLSGDPAEALSFGSTPGGLTSAQLASIYFYSDAGLTFVGMGESLGGGGGVIAAIPEPTTYLAAALAFGLLGWQQRRRLQARRAGAAQA